MTDIVDVVTLRTRKGRPPVTDREQRTSEDVRLLCAFILLRKGISAARVAIDPKVNLSIDLVRQAERLLKQFPL